MALASNHVNNEDQQDVEGKASMANSLVGGGVNVRKTRIISFERTDLLPQGWTKFIVLFSLLAFVFFQIK